jgi:hypothetical protein
MATGAQSEVPTGMQRISRRFERWRRSHRGRLPIAERLWPSAAEVVREYGVFRTSKVWHLEYGKLERLAKAAAASRRPAAPPTALELMSPSGVPSGPGLSECLIELEGLHGKMRIHWKGATGADLAGLSRVLWESA